MSVALRAARDVRSAGGDAVIVATAARARHVEGTFDAAILSMNLPDGSGVVLAAELLLEDRVREVAFFHPVDEEIAQRASTTSVRKAVRDAIDAEPAEQLAAG